MLQKINESLLIIGTVKNVGSRLKKNIKKLTKLEKYFSNLEFLIYENNSSDNTKKILADLEKTYSFFHFISEDLSQNKIAEICKAKKNNVSPCHIEIISYARNVLCEEIKKNFHHFDFILNIDFDVFWFNPFDIVRVINRARRKNIDFDCISANGLTKRLRYRDAFAFRNEQFPFGPEFLGDSWWNFTRLQIQKRHKNKLYLPVYSAFGGAAVYKIKAYIVAHYSALPNKIFFEINEKIKTKCTDKELLNKISTEPKSYSKYDKPVLCEHVPFHYELIQNGFNKLFIDTSWKILFLD